MDYRNRFDLNKKVIHTFITQGETVYHPLRTDRRSVRVNQDEIEERVKKDSGDSNIVRIWKSDDKRVYDIEKYEAFYSFRNSERYGFYDSVEETHLSMTSLNGTRIKDELGNVFENSDIFQHEMLIQGISDYEYSIPIKKKSAYSRNTDQKTFHNGIFDVVNTAISGFRELILKKQNINKNRIPTITNDEYESVKHSVKQGQYYEYVVPYFDIEKHEWMKDFGKYWNIYKKTLPVQYSESRKMILRITPYFGFSDSTVKYLLKQIAHDVSKVLIHGLTSIDRAKALINYYKKPEKVKLFKDLFRIERGGFILQCIKSAAFGEDTSFKIMGFKHYCNS